MKFVRVALVLLLVSAGVVAKADDTTSSAAPVKAVADHQMQVSSPRGGKGKLPLYVSRDWSKPLPEVTRVLIFFHGKLRNADVYNASGLAAIKAAGDAGKTTLLITPQFLGQQDVDHWHLSQDTLHWAPEAWMGGEDAMNGAISSFDCVDAILAYLRNKTIFPNLKTVIIGGHSGGAQVVQRYAVVSTAGDLLMRAGIHVRYVIANPSSYLYFSPQRPALNAKEEFTFGAPSKSCMGHYNLWKYGTEKAPPYVDAAADWDAIETHYVRRDVVYLLGTKDTDPDHPALDKSCSGEMEGPYRFFRGKAYFTYLEGRHPELKQEGASQQLWFVPGVEHDGDKMFNSPCGLAAVFGGECSSRELAPKP
ncbi:hypothetical protein ACFQBQ_09450 [Granulicella cerasi]|uniref:Alpha/beta hydrolase family protein n=1 Tax=Granulicella cerasi TaxID=741063 RepID=A0ABW1Z9C2_9BACT|nr:hypothetical protein [Granulicella cerasi]